MYSKKVPLYTKTFLNNGYDYPHCSAIALAIPWYVLDRIFHLSFDGGNLF
jgi:hypothetical protein